MKLVSKNIFAAVSLAVMALATVSSAQAAGSTKTAAFTASSTIGSTCVVSATNVAFGSINPAATGTAVATGTISSTCTKSTAYTLNINAGSGTFTARTMAGGTSGNTDKLAYNLYTDSAYTNVFGDATGSTKNVSLTGTGAVQSTTVYGSLSLNQYLTPDTYTDNLTVTLSY